MLKFIRTLKEKYNHWLERLKYENALHTHSQGPPFDIPLGCGKNYVTALKMLYKRTQSALYVFVSDRYGATEIDLLKKVIARKIPVTLLVNNVALPSWVREYEQRGKIKVISVGMFYEATVTPDETGFMTEEVRAVIISDGADIIVSKRYQLQIGTASDRMYCATLCFNSLQARAIMQVIRELQAV